MSATPLAARAVLVADVELAGSRAWLVRDADEPDRPGRPRPAVLWLHWLGHVRNGRGEFLPHAVELASRGVVSLLPAGTFPWVTDPDGTAADVDRVRTQLDAHAAALDLLLAQPDVDPARVAVVGHDYGGMYAALLAQRDPRVSALALQACDAGWASWFATYWLGLDDPGRADYARLFDGLDPVGHVSRLGDRVLLQWAGQDTFVTGETRAAYAAANPHARTHLYDKADHQMGDRAGADLTAFLAEQLGL